jgi:hypothetical protein
VTGTGTGTTPVIAITSGNNQGQVINTILDDPFIVTVTSGGSPLQNIYVTFVITSYPYHASGQSLSSYGGNTDASGQLSTILTLGDEEGDYNIVATVLGVTESPVTFTATANAPTTVYYILSE